MGSLLLEAITTLFFPTKEESQMQPLTQGVQDFQTKNFQTMRDLFAQLAQGQHPETLFITCSDSRVDPNLLTQTKPGELFVLRNAGNIVPPHGSINGGEAATIEYAVNALGVKNIIICGHSHCGAMKGLLHPEQLTDFPAVVAWLSYAQKTKQRVDEKYSDLPDGEPTLNAAIDGEPTLNAAIEENVLVQIENLRTLPSVAARVARGDLNIYGWVYRFETGEVFAYEPDAQRFVPLV
ncbi:MAG: carbonic anhydrase [Chloroflexales bacterium]|nr:carbonic anhydrase [Chloroflexales bacterium]